MLLTMFSKHCSFLVPQYCVIRRTWGWQLRFLHLQAYLNIWTIFPMYLSPPFRPRTILLAVVTITLIFFILFTARSAAPHAYLRNSWLDFVRHKDHLHTSPTPSNPGDGRGKHPTCSSLTGANSPSCECHIVRARLYLSQGFLRSIR